MKKLMEHILIGENEFLEFKTSFNKETIEFFNPGNLYGGITIKELLTNSYTSRSRNKLIAKAFKEIGLIERYGSGIKRIMNICFDYGVIAPNFEEIHNGFKVVLFKEKLKTKNNVVDNVVDVRREKIINILNTKSKATAKLIAVLLNSTERTIQRDLKKLKELKRIKRVGADKTGHWKVISLKK